MVWLAGIGTFLKSKLGAIGGAIAMYMLEKAFNFVAFAIKTWAYWKQREKVQEKALEKVKDDVETGAPRTDDTRKREDDWLNS